MESSGSGVNLPILISLLIFFLVPHQSSSVRVCEPASCNKLGLGPEVRFPFRLKGKHDQSCGYPGFDLFCNNHSQTILNLPRSGNFIVDWINYSTQSIYISDAESCLSRQILDFSAVGSTFKPAPYKNYTYFNCSSNWSEYANVDHAVPVVCFDDYNWTVLAASSRYSSGEIPSTCRLIPNVSFPLHLSYIQDWSGTIVREDLKLKWDEPAGCRSCEQRGLYCGFKSDSGLETGCVELPSRGLPRSAKYGIIIGVGIPGLIALTALACYLCGKLRDFGQRRSVNTELSTAAMNPLSSVTVSGLDEPTIESYPMTVIGESRRFPKLSDGTCPICLSEYQPKETLRSIPECNHHFHASCIDEWLRLNGTCPLCRNSPESRSMTPSSSTSSTLSTPSSA